MMSTTSVPQGPNGGRKHVDMRTNPVRDEMPCRAKSYFVLTGLREAFDAIVKNDHSLFKEVAEWNLAMTYLKLDDEESLNKTLEGIVQQRDHQYYEPAKDLLSRL
jgi:hypothetical protein